MNEVKHYASGNRLRALWFYSLLKVDTIESFIANV